MTVSIYAARGMRCIGSNPENTGDRVDTGERTLWMCRTDNCLAWRFVKQSDPETDPLNGYCGLAGKPE